MRSQIRLRPRSMLFGILLSACLGPSGCDGNKNGEGEASPSRTGSHTQQKTVPSGGGVSSPERTTPSGRGHGVKMGALVVCNTALSSNLESDDVLALQKSAVSSFLQKEGLAGVSAIVEILAGNSGGTPIDYYRGRALSKLLAEILSGLYASGHLGSISDLIRAIDQNHNDGSGVKFGLTGAMLIKLVRSGDEKSVVRGFEEVCQDFSGQKTSIKPLAVAAASYMGFEKALALVPEYSLKEAAGVDAVNFGIIERWLSEDPVKCSQFVRDFPEGARKRDYIQHMVSSLAYTGRIEDAEMWLATLPPDSGWAINAKNAIKEAKERAKN